MIIGQEFVWHQDHFVYHITEKQNIESIIKYGLIPTIGNRSLLAGDKFKAIFFFDKLYNLEDWMDFLYKNKDKNSLEVLRFNIKRLKGFIHNGGEEFYIKNHIPAEKIDYLKLYNEERLITFNEMMDKNVYDLDYRWNKLKEYYKK